MIICTHISSSYKWRFTFRFNFCVFLHLFFPKASLLVLVKVSLLCFFSIYFLLLVISLVVIASEIDCLERLISEMIYEVSSWMSNDTHLLTYSQKQVPHTLQTATVTFSKTHQKNKKSRVRNIIWIPAPAIGTLSMVCIWSKPGFGEITAENDFGIFACLTWTLTVQASTCSGR